MTSEISNLRSPNQNLLEQRVVDLIMSGLRKKGRVRFPAKINGPAFPVQPERLLLHSDLPMTQLKSTCRGIRVFIKAESQLAFYARSRFPSNQLSRSGHPDCFCTGCLCACFA